MRYLDVDGLGPVSRIGLGTWQFGAREWGYGEGYAEGAAPDIVRHTALGRPVLSNQVQFSLAHAPPLDELVPFAQRRTAS